MIAHQATIRRQKRGTRPRMTTLVGCTVAPVSYAEARALIEQYEYLGRMNNRPAALYGLRSPSGELLGVSCFGRPGGSNALNVCGAPERTMALERGAYAALGLLAVFWLALFGWGLRRLRLAGGPPASPVAWTEPQRDPYTVRSASG